MLIFFGWMTKVLLKIDPIQFLLIHADENRSFEDGSSFPKLIASAIGGFSPHRMSSNGVKGVIFVGKRGFEVEHLAPYPMQSGLLGCETGNFWMSHTQQKQLTQIFLSPTYYQKQTLP